MNEIDSWIAAVVRSMSNLGHLALVTDYAHSATIECVLGDCRAITIVTFIRVHTDYASEHLCEDAALLTPCSGPGVLYFENAS